jgi:hypothetical protein
MRNNLTSFANAGRAVVMGGRVVASGWHYKLKREVDGKPHPENGKRVWLEKGTTL